MKELPQYYNDARVYVAAREAMNPKTEIFLEPDEFSKLMGAMAAIERFMDDEERHHVLFYGIKFIPKLETL